MEKSKITKEEYELEPFGKLQFFIRETPGDLKDNITDRIVIREIFEENVYQMEAKDVEGGIVLDIGANVGMFSIYASLLGAKQVISYEPEDDNGEIFKKNIKANGIENIELRQFAVSSKNETIEIYKSQAASKRIEYVGESNCPKQTVKAVSINDILNALEEVAVLKIDCEWAEYGIFETISQENMKKLAYITAEFHDTDAKTFGLLIAKLSLTHNIHTIGRYNGGGQIYARRY
jgi:FkbM family methyltransferase